MPVIVLVLAILMALVAVAFTLAVAGYAALVRMTRFPDPKPEDPPRGLGETDGELAEQLRTHVEALAGRIGERNVWRPEALEAAGGYIREHLTGLGYPVVLDAFPAGGVTVANLEAVLPGAAHPEEILVLGAHYDTVRGCPGANDNASGVAVLLELARLLRDRPLERTVRFVAFVNEEKPFSRNPTSGSVVYARRARLRHERITAMLSLETMGYFDRAPGSQRYPAPLSRFYPGCGNFIAFVGNLGSHRLVRSAVTAFRRHSDFPSEAGALPGRLPGIGWSDHWSFWEEGYPAIMVTDTAPFRYPAYHRPEDTPEKVDYTALARITAGLAAAAGDLAGGEVGASSAKNA